MSPVNSAVSTTAISTGSLIHLRPVIIIINFLVGLRRFVSSMLSCSAARKKKKLIWIFTTTDNRPPPLNLLIIDLVYAIDRLRRHRRYCYAYGRTQAIRNDAISRTDVYRNSDTEFHNSRERLSPPILTLMLHSTIPAKVYSPLYVSLDACCFRFSNLFRLEDSLRSISNDTFHHHQCREFVFYVNHFMRIQ